ncbi:hypothetical protein RHSIM_Rhsim09G0051700 [Rhododendron simsii]|uniref:Uncharacterized protein n=1 Tax=Rhododendron simsii TaxID=118357 RepID=A0A834GEF4_RHOSS|nr:hypothetical protein RHSIM_Rhsim09G0051700 [Rhododendron simsii]
MGQQSLIYSFVARGTVVLAEYTEFTGNFTGIASQCLQKLPATNNKFTYNCDGHTFNYLVENGFIICGDEIDVGESVLIHSFSILLMLACSKSIFVEEPMARTLSNEIQFVLGILAYCVVAVESAGRQIPIAFLERVKDDFNKRYAGGKAATAVAKSLNKEFGPKLKEQMQYCVDHPEEISKLAKVKAQVSEVKGVMMENIEKVLDRGEKIELLVDKTENLRSQLTPPAGISDMEGRVVFLRAHQNLCGDEWRPLSFACARFQAAGDTDKEEDVVPEHEDKIDRFRHSHCADSRHFSVHMPWLQMFLIKIALFDWFSGLFLMSCLQISISRATRLPSLSALLKALKFELGV